MSSNSPLGGRGLIAAFVEACLAILLGCLALYGAVQVVTVVWVQLCIGLAVIAAIGLVILLAVWRLRRW